MISPQTNHHSRLTAKLHELGIIVLAGMLALVSVTGCKPATPVSSVSRRPATTPAPTNAVRPTTSAAVQPPATAIAVGGTSTCALRSGGSVACWYQGIPTPVPVLGLADATAIAAGNDHTCALTGGGGVRCWGNNAYGALGDGTVTTSLIPVSVLGVTDATAIAAGWFHTCAIRSGGGVMCWGMNSNGLLGNGTLTNPNISSPRTNSLIPVPVVGITDAIAIAAGSQHTCALRSGGSVVCWGVGFRLGGGALKNSPTPVPVSGIADATAVAAGNGHTCALVSGGSIKCWGGNSEGQLGAWPPPGPLSNSQIPVPIQGIADATAITAGFDCTCALRSGGSVVCWGGNSEGQLGDGTRSDSPTPVPVAGIADATAVASGFKYTCILRSDGSIKCWGR